MGASVIVRAVVERLLVAVVDRQHLEEELFAPGLVLRQRGGVDGRGDVREAARAGGGGIVRIPSLEFLRLYGVDLRDERTRVGRDDAVGDARRRVGRVGREVELLGEPLVEGCNECVRHLDGAAAAALDLDRIIRIACLERCVEPAGVRRVERGGDLREAVFPDAQGEAAQCHGGDALDELRAVVGAVFLIFASKASTSWELPP